MLFVDYSSAFNPILRPQTCEQTGWSGDSTPHLHVDQQLPNWTQSKGESRSSYIWGPQHQQELLQSCVLSPWLYILYTHECTPAHHINIIVKFADDTTVVGLISRGWVCLQRRGWTASSLVNWEQSDPQHIKDQRAGDWLQEEKKMTFNHLSSNGTMWSRFRTSASWVSTSGRGWPAVWQLGGAEESPAGIPLLEGAQEE